MPKDSKHSIRRKHLKSPQLIVLDTRVAISFCLLMKTASSDAVRAET